MNANGMADGSRRFSRALVLGVVAVLLLGNLALAAPQRMRISAGRYPLKPGGVTRVDAACIDLSRATPVRTDLFRAGTPNLFVVKHTASGAIRKTLREAEQAGWIKPPSGGDSTKWVGFEQLDPQGRYEVVAEGSAFLAPDAADLKAALDVLEKQQPDLDKALTELDQVEAALRPLGAGFDEPLRRFRARMQSDFDWRLTGTETKLSPATVHEGLADVARTLQRADPHATLLAASYRKGGPLTPDEIAVLRKVIKLDIADALPAADAAMMTAYEQAVRQVRDGFPEGGAIARNLTAEVAEWVDAGEPLSVAMQQALRDALGVRGDALLDTDYLKLLADGGWTDGLAKHLRTHFGVEVAPPRGTTERCLLFRPTREGEGWIASSPQAVRQFDGLPDLRALRELLGPDTTLVLEEASTDLARRLARVGRVTFRTLEDVRMRPDLPAKPVEVVLVSSIDPATAARLSGGQDGADVAAIASKFGGIGVRLVDSTAKLDETLATIGKEGKQAVVFFDNHRDVAAIVHASARIADGHGALACELLQPDGLPLGTTMKLDMEAALAAAVKLRDAGGPAKLDEWMNAWVEAYRVERAAQSDARYILTVLHRRAERIFTDFGDMGVTRADPDRLPGAGGAGGDVPGALFITLLLLDDALNPETAATQPATAPDGDRPHRQD